jgi:transcriptional regulator with XRE-family HTH domain
MPAPSVDVRRRSFAAFVQRVTAQAEQSRGLSIPQIAQLAGINNATIYRWRDGVGTRLPLPEQVVAFCDALGIPPVAAFSILWPGKDNKPAEPEPLPQDPEVEQQMRALLRKIADPNVSDAEKVTIRATIRHLAGDAPSTTRRRAAG